MEVTPIFSRAFNDYKNNPKFIVPHAVELAVDGALVAAFAIVLLISALTFIPSFSVRGILTLAHGNAPFVIIGLTVFSAVSLFFMITLLGSAARAAIITMAKETGGNGRTDLKTGLKGVKNFTWDIFLFKAITGVVVLFLLALAMVPFALGSDFLGVFALVLALILSLVIYLFIFLTPQFVVTLGDGVLTGFKASINFVVDNFTSVLKYIAVVIGLSIGLALIVNLFGLIGNIIENPVLRLGFNIFHFMLSIIINLSVAPYFDIVKTYMVNEVF